MRIFRYSERLDVRPSPLRLQAKLLLLQAKNALDDPLQHARAARIRHGNTARRVRAIVSTSRRHRL